MQVINAANEVVDSIDTDELAKFLAIKSDPEDEEAEVYYHLSITSSPYCSFCSKRFCNLELFFPDWIHGSYSCRKSRRRWRQPAIN